MGKRLTGALLGVVAILGMKFYSKVSAHDDVKERLVALCAADAECVADVQRHYDGCFDASYTLHERHTASRLNVDDLVRCVNTRSGVPYFAVYQEDQRP